MNKSVLENILEKFKKRTEQTPLESFRDDTKDYLTGILKDYNVPEFTIAEIAGFVTVKTYIFASDAINQEFKRWERAQRRQAKELKKIRR